MTYRKRSQEQRLREQRLRDQTRDSFAPSNKGWALGDGNQDNKAKLWTKTMEKLWKTHRNSENYGKTMRKPWTTMRKRWKSYQNGEFCNA